MKQRVKNRHIFLEWYENVWGKEDWNKIPCWQANLLALCTFLSSLQYQHEVPPTRNMKTLKMSGYNK